MSKQFWLVGFVALCIVLPGCGKTEEPEPVAPAAPAVAAKPKPKPKPEPKPAPSAADDLTEYIPPSLTTAMGAKMNALNELSQATGIDFAAEIAPATLTLLLAGLGPADIDEFWVGANPAGNDNILCARMVKQYDRAKLRAALQIGDALGKIGGVELHVLPALGGEENAIAFVSEKVLMIGRRKTLEESLKDPKDGAVRFGLTAAGAERAAYWVAGDANTYVTQLSHHGFAGFAAKADANVPPAGFALVFPGSASPSANRPQAAVNRNNANRNRSGRKGKGKDDDEEDEDRGILSQGLTLNHSATAQQASPQTAPPTGVVNVILGFAYSNEQDALRMERRVRSVMDGMPHKLKSAASYNVAWTDSTTDTPAGTPSHSVGRFGRDSRDMLEDLSRDLRPTLGPSPAHHPVFPQERGLFWRGKGKDKNDRNRRGGKGKNDDDDDSRPRIRVGAPVPNSRNTPGIQIPTANVSFQYDVTREGNNLRVQATMDLPRSMVSIAAAVQQACGGTLTGGGMYPGTLATVSAAMNFWGQQTKGNRRGVKRVPDMPVLAGYSWMTELLPYLGRGDLYGAIDFEKSWMTHPDNYRIAGTVIPQFLNPAAANAKWQGYPYNGLGLTNFVGMSGVEDGPNVVAAALKRTDPRAGIFGYDDMAKPREITDGAGKTIMLLGSGRLAGPWIQGGGATIRGAREPYFDEMSGFQSPGLQSRGTVVLFADGSSREISADIDPQVFRAMCTIHGAEKVDIPAGTPLTGVPPTVAPPSTPSPAGGINNILNFFKSGGE